MKTLISIFVVATLWVGAAHAALDPVSRQAISSLTGAGETAGTAASCSVGSHTTRVACEGASGVWTDAVAGTSNTGIYEIEGIGTLLVAVLVGFVIAVTGGFYVVRWIRRMFGEGRSMASTRGARGGGTFRSWSRGSDRRHPSPTQSAGRRHGGMPF